MAKNFGYKPQFCIHCGRKDTLILIQRTEEVDIRGERISIEAAFYRCEACGEEFEHSRPDNDPVAQAYREYRRRKGMLQPEEIREFRKKIGFSQEELGELIGTSLEMIKRYEEGALQDEVHDRMIRTYRP